MFKLRVQETLCSEARVLRGSEPSGCPLSKKIDDKVVHRKWIFTSDMAKKTRKICLITVCWIQFISGKLALWKNVETNLPIPHHSAFSNDPAVELSPANSVYWGKVRKRGCSNGAAPAVTSLESWELDSENPQIAEKNPVRYWDLAWC